MHADVCACVKLCFAGTSGPSINQAGWIGRALHESAYPCFSSAGVTKTANTPSFFYMGAGGSIQAFYGLSHLPSPRTLLSKRLEIPNSLYTSWQCLLNSLNLVL